MVIDGLAAPEAPGNLLELSVLSNLPRHTGSATQEMASRNQGQQPL